MQPATPWLKAGGVAGQKGHKAHAPLRQLHFRFRCQNGNAKTLRFMPTPPFL